MKFSAVALLSFAVAASAELDPAFVEQCCSTYFKDHVLAFNFPFGIAGVANAGEWESLTMDNVAGKLSDACKDMTLQGTLIDSDYCVSYEDVCKYWTYSADPIETGCVTAPGTDCFGGLFGVVTGELKSGTELLCCPKGEPNCSEAQDNPWTCQNFVGTFTAGPKPTGGLFGLACGRTNLCKDPNGVDLCVVGDPHFQLWGGEWFDFHGECDLKYVENKDFASGLGLEIQIRTKARYEYSFVESASVRIGDDILEVSAYGQHFLNGVEAADLKDSKMGEMFEVEHNIMDSHHHVYNIYTGVKNGDDDELIQIKTFKDLVAVRLASPHSDSLGKSHGMMGEYGTGNMLARDGKTIVTDPIEFGMEWQVKAEEKTLFQTPSPVTGKCVMPSAGASAERRRLGEAVPLEAAVAACEAVNHVHHENCVYDVMATGDLEIVHSGVF